MYGCFVMDILWAVNGVDAPIHELFGTPTIGAGVPKEEPIIDGATALTIGVWLVLTLLWNPEYLWVDAIVAVKREVWTAACCERI